MDKFFIILFKKLPLLIAVISIFLIAYIFLGRLYGYRIFDQKSGRACGFAWRDYGNCDKGYYCESDPNIMDVPGKCAKIVRGKTYIAYKTLNLYYPNENIAIEVSDFKPEANDVTWYILAKKNNQTGDFKIALRGFESKKINILGHEFKFDGLDIGVDRTRVKITLLK